jgi:hypothetical protein
MEHTALCQEREIMANKTFSSFEEYWDSLTEDGRNNLAKLAGMNKNFLWQVARGYRKAGPKTLAKLYKVDKCLTPQVLRPDLY